MPGTQGFNGTYGVFPEHTSQCFVTRVCGVPDDSCHIEYIIG